MYDRLPQELKDIKQWVVWRYEMAGEKKTKVLYNPNNPTNKSATTRPFQWSDFKTAVFIKEDMRFDGIGFVFTEEDPYIGIDIDHCFDPETKELYPEFNFDLNVLDSYTEYSPSKSGLHIICKGVYPNLDMKGHKRGSYEMYYRQRFFTITGNVYKGKNMIKELPEGVLHTFYITKLTDMTKPIKRFVAHRPIKPPVLTNEKIIDLCKTAANSSKFNALWSGQTTGYSSQSEAELALSNILAFYTKDMTQIQQLLIESGLYRQKLERVDYITSTIQKSLDMITEQYDPLKSKKMLKDEYINHLKDSFRMEGFNKP
jgi:primase-polymerase (primpol)-like protein